MLPEEILHAIVQYLVYNPNIVERELLNPPRQYCTAAILPLSVANRQFRRICFEFLFVYVEVRRAGELKQLLSHCLESATFSTCIRTLDIARPALAADHKLLPQLLLQLLPCLSSLSCLLTITVKIDMELIHALNRHPSATMVIKSFSKLPREMVHSGDLGKVILKSSSISGGDESTYNSSIARLRESGIQLEELVVHSAGYLKEPFANSRFHGLVELELKMESYSISDMAWLSTFIFAHPHLKKISFTDFHYTYFENDTALIFIDPFIKAMAQEGLTSASYVKGFAITRDSSKSSTEVLHHWCITGLFLHILASLEQVLYLASSMFPKISVLTIYNAPCRLDDLVTSLQQFSLLRIVSLLCTFQRLDFGSDEPWRDPGIVEVYEGSLLGPVATEFAMVWCTSRIAKLIPSIQAFYVKEERHNSAGETGGGWAIQGWILVHDLQLNHPIQLHVSPPTRRPGWQPGWRPNSTPLRYFQTTLFV
ncbi:hypothetical protein C8R42DRAFT_677102 [Lentinula raphanica]|nr:hypothetical protein C8R42DRAFT_677102 [Lentinula raphanica]